MAEPVRPRWTPGRVALSLIAAGLVPGCAMVPRGQLEESQRITRSLRTENARLKDEVVNLQAQNRDYADRALDDLRRLTARDQALDRLEQSIRGYQDDRDRLAAAYRSLATSLGRSTDEDAFTSSAPHAGPSRVGSAGRHSTENLNSKEDADENPAAAPAPPGRSGP